MVSTVELYIKQKELNEARAVKKPNTDASESEATESTSGNGSVENVVGALTLSEFPFLRLIIDQEGINKEWAAIQKEKLEEGTKRVRAEHQAVSVTNHDEVIKYGEHISQKVAQQAGSELYVGQSAFPSAEWRAGVKATHQRSLEQNYLVLYKHSQEFIAAFQERMAIRMGDKISKVLFQGLPIIVPYADQRVKGSWVERLQTAIRRADRNEIVRSDLYDVINDIAPQLMQLQITQISQACFTNPSTENIRNLHSLIENRDYLKVMSNDLVSQLTQAESISESADSAPAILKLFGHRQSTDGLVGLQETFNVMQDGDVVEKKSVLSSILDIITFEKFSAKDVPAFLAQYLYLKAINLVEKTRSSDLEKMWTQEVMRRLGELLVIVFQEYAKLDRHSPSYDQQIAHYERVHDLAYFAIGQVIESVNSQVTHTNNRINEDKIYSLYLAKQILRLHNGTNIKSEQRILAKFRR